MNIRQFVSGSSLVLAGWLGATFLNEVPAQRYPKQDKSAAAAHHLPADHAAPTVIASAPHALAR